MLIVLFTVGALLELAVYAHPTLWKYKKILIGFSIAVTAFATGRLVVSSFSPVILLVILVGIYRLFNLARLVKGRRNEQYLRHECFRSSYIFIMSQVLAVIGSYVVVELGLSAHDLLVAVATLQLVVALLLLSSTLRSLYKTKFNFSSEYIADRDLPSLTVAIPARNEMQNLAECLESVLSSNYPKLEILVLDDCSQDKTSNIIRDFAHAGIRFIGGKPPSENWVGKNEAYSQLAHEATGSYILYLSADIRLNIGTVRSLVVAALRKKKAMVSILPLSIDNAVAENLFKSIRNWWELALPRRLFNKPPVTSSCWLIKKNELYRLGGFEAVSNSILPEAYFARELIKNDGYSFMRSDLSVGVQTSRNTIEGYQSLLRLRYPQLRRRPENILIMSAAELMILTMPFVLSIAGFWLSLGPVQFMTIISSLILLLTHILIIGVIKPGQWWVLILSFPLTMLAEVIVAHLSMFKYEFSIVDWRGRDVCVPVMHAEPHLPPMHGVKTTA